MITLCTWLPTSATAVIEERIVPDIGHSSLRVAIPNGDETYISFWPEIDGLVGRLTYAMKPRMVRNPQTYAIECDHAQPYMQRPPDFEDTVDGLDEARVLAAWQSILDLPYDLKRWNCSSVNRLLILIAMDPSCIGPVIQRADFSGEELSGAAPLEQFGATMLELATANLFNCKPMDVRRLVRVLSNAIDEDSSSPSTPAPTPTAWPVPG